jgi:hypothetical protein
VREFVESRNVFGATGELGAWALFADGKVAFQTAFESWTNLMRHHFPQVKRLTGGE